MDGRLSDSKKITMKLHVRGGFASARQLKRVSEYSDGGNARLATEVERLLQQREVCCPFDKAPYLPVVGASTVSTYDQKLRVDLLSLSVSIALHATDV